LKGNLFFYHSFFSFFVVVSQFHQHRIVPAEAYALQSACHFFSNRRGIEFKPIR